MSAVLNTISFNKKLENLTKSKSFIAFARNAAETRTNAAKENLIESLMEEPVIKEIQEASKDPSIQNSEFVSKGNLVAALGFHQGSDPAGELAEYLEENIYQKESSPKINWSPNKTQYSFSINYPSKNQINEHFSSDAESKLEWTNRSWIDIIENGISNALKKYIFWSEGFKPEGISRSTTGLQSKGSVKNVATLTPSKFLTKLLDNFKKQINK